MGCTSSTQTTALDTTRPNTKHEGSTSGTSNENGGLEADSETIPHQESPQTCSAPPDHSEEIQSSTAAEAHTEPEAAAAEPEESVAESEAAAAEPEESVAEPEACAAEPITSEPAESDPSMTAENTEEPAPSENTTEDQADSSPPEETPASGEDS